MAPHSNTLAWKIPWMEEPGRLQSMGLLRVGHNWSDFTFTFHFHALEKEMATHSSVLAWRIPGTGEPGGLPSMGSHSRWVLSDSATPWTAACQASLSSTASRSLLLLMVWIKEIQRKNSRGTYFGQLRVMAVMKSTDIWMLLWSRVFSWHRLCPT